MEWLEIRKWDTFQHYTKRNPPWIKLYNALLDDYDFTTLPDVAKGHLMCIWMLASRNGGRIPSDLSWIKERISATENIDLETLKERQFLVPARKRRKRNDSKMIAPCKQNATPETETETETEGEGENKDIQSDKPDYEGNFLLLWDQWKPHRTPKGSKKQAAAEWDRHVRKEGVALDLVLKAAIAYCKQCKRTDTSSQHVLRWIKHHRWEDDHGPLVEGPPLFGTPEFEAYERKWG